MEIWQINLQLKNQNSKYAALYELEASFADKTTNTWPD